MVPSFFSYSSIILFYLFICLFSCCFFLNSYNIMLWLILLWKQSGINLVVLKKFNNYSLLSGYLLTHEISFFRHLHFKFCTIRNKIYTQFSFSFIQKATIYTQIWYFLYTNKYNLHTYSLLYYVFPCVEKVHLSVNYHFFM